MTHSRTTTICLFDVDGTLTYPRQVISILSCSTMTVLIIFDSFRK